MSGHITNAPAIYETQKLATESLWQALKDAIRGTSADYTKINLKRAIFLLAVPMILELIGESLFAILDIYFVGSIGSWAVTTVGLTEAYLFFLYSIGMGVSYSVTAIIARRTGEGNKQEAGVAAIMAGAGLTVDGQARPDLAGIPRALVVRR